MDSPDTVTTNMEGTAEFFVISVPTMRRWISAGCPVEEAGNYDIPYQLDLRKVEAWRMECISEEQTQNDRRAEEQARSRLELLWLDNLEGVGNSRLTAREEYWTYRRDKERAAAAQFRGELVRANTTTRGRLRALPDERGRDFGLPTDIVERMIARIDDVLKDYVSLPSLLWCIITPPKWRTFTPSLTARSYGRLIAASQMNKTSSVPSMMILTRSSPAVP